MYSKKVTYSTIESAIEALKWCSANPDYHFTKTRAKHLEKLLELKRGLRHKKLKIVKV